MSDRNYVVELDSDDYHADKGFGDEILFSKSRAHTLLAKSPAHVKAEHPILTPQAVREVEDRFDLGNAVHAVILEGNEDILVRLEHKDYRSSAAKDDRDMARADDKIPMLADQHDRVLEMVAAIREQAPTFFVGGKPEVTIVWTGAHGCRWKARLDYLVTTPGLEACHDLKTTRYSASPEAWSRSMVSIGADIQSVIYRQGMRAVFELDIPLTFVVVETTPPYAMSFHDLSPALIKLAEERADFAARTWVRCLKSGIWDGYPKQICYAEPAGYAETAFYERMYRDEESS